MFLLGCFLEQNKQKKSSNTKKLLSPSANKIHFVIVNLLCCHHLVRTDPKGKYHDSWRQGCMPGTMVRGCTKGYINKKHFADYGKK